MSARAESADLRSGWARVRGPRAIGIFGIALGALSFWLTLPPAQQRNLAVARVGVRQQSAGAQ